MTHVVTCFLRYGTDVLLGRRSDAVGTYVGRWAGVSGYVEGDPSDAERDARREVREETGWGDATLVRAGAPVDVEDGEPRERYGAYGRAWAAYVRDPDGRRVELKMH